MNLSSNTPHKKARIEIIPLIDIMFFLLASFMLVSMSMIKLQKIETKLPSDKKAPPSTEKHDFVIIGIGPDNGIYFDKDQAPIQADAIPARLQPFYVRGKEDTRVFINCDLAASYNTMVEALDAVRQVGITKVGFAVKQDNHFDPAKPRPNTHPDMDAAAGGAAPASP